MPGWCVVYYDFLESTLEENDLMDKPCQVFNTDESGMPLDPPSLKIVAPFGAKALSSDLYWK